MSFSGAVQWWDAWQLRVLVLGSLFIQYFLFFFSMVRQLALPSWLRLLSWLAYLGGDALAIYALATLFNRHKQQPADGSGLEVLWTPVLLIHLGGQHTMTAYNIEDNELWVRHAITVVSQVTVALYVFCKSWSGEKRLLQAAILLFVVGIIRSIQKPWALKKASISGMTAFSSPSSRKEQGMVALLCGKCTSFFGTKFFKKGREEEAAEEIDIPLEEFVQEASRCVPRSELESGQVKAQDLYSNAVKESGQVKVQDLYSNAVKKSGQVKVQDLYSNAVKISGQVKAQDLEHVCMLLVDISTPYSSRIKILRLLMAHDYLHAYFLSYRMLTWSFGFLYTKMSMISSGLGLCLHLLLPFLTFASTILFSTSHKCHDYNATDVKIIYILFFSTMLLDFILLLFSPILLVVRVKVPQYNFWSFCARKKRPTILMKIAAVVCCKDYVNMHCYTQHTPSKTSIPITNLVLGYVRDGWTGYIHDAASYRRFNSHRGQWTLNKHSLGGDKRLGWSLKMAFDRSVLLWHIATDLCFHHQNTTPDGQERAAPSREISNYMAYLLFIRPEMLMLGTRNGIFTVACDDVELMMGGELAPDVGGLARGILQRAQQPPWSYTSEIGALVPTACRLAEALMELHDEGERWEVVQGVWLEMLCYSAGRCRGYLHAKNMSEGPHLLSHVWFLMSFMGMDTSCDRYQKPEPPETKEEEEEGGDDGGEGRSVEHEINISV